MSKEVLGKCPVCESELEVTRITCNECNTNIEGHFHLCKFCKLTAEQKAFIDVFIKCRGNIKEVEKELGVSYPTVKNKLEDAVGALGHKTERETADPNKRAETLERLNRGEITAEEAINLLNE